jgi:hypothetical protein
LSYGGDDHLEKGKEIANETLDDHLEEVKENAKKTLAVRENGLKEMK